MFLNGLVVLLFLLNASYLQARDVAVDKLDKQILEIEAYLESRGPTGRDASKDAHAWKNLGLLYQSKDAVFHQGGMMQPLALDAYNKALELNDVDAEFVVQVNQQKGILLKTMGLPEEAILASEIVYSRATSDYDKSASYSMRADAYSLMGEVDTALKFYNKALELTYYQINLYLPLTECYKEVGTFSKDEWRTMLTRMESDVKKYTSAGYVTKAVKEDLKKSYLFPLNTVIGESIHNDVYWAMHNAADKAGLLDLAWKYLEKAHTGRLAAQSPSVTLEDIDRMEVQIKSIFTTGFWSPNVGSKNTVPIFIVGMMRSGSTLLETMLDSHPSVWGLGEDSIFNGNLPAFRDEVVRGATQFPGNTDVVQATVIKHAKHVVKEMKIISATYIEKNKSTKRDKTAKKKVEKITDKMLFNFRNIGFIHMMFPEASILHTMRDPMDTLLSCYKHKFDDRGLDWSQDIDKLASQFASYLELMHHFRTVLPGRFMDIRYESVVEDNEKAMRRVIKRIGLKWDPAVLDFHSSNRTVQTNSMQQVRKKIYKQAVGSWVRYANQLEPLRQAFLKYVPGLRRKGALVYPDSVNWDCSADWDYAAAEAAAKNEEVYVGESSRSLLGGDDDDDEDEGVEEDDGEAVVKDDNEEEEVEEEEDDDEDEKELIEKKRRRRRKRGGPGRRRKQREEETNSENEDDDSNEGVTERGRGRRRRNRRRGRGREASSRRKNRRAKQENDEEGENEDEEDDSVADVSSSKGKKTALESGPSSKPTNRKDRMEHENRLRAKLAAKETSGKRQKYKGPSIEEMDSRARQLMIKYTINSKGGENEDGEDDVDVDAEAESDTNVAANLYYAALSKKGISPIIVSKMIKSVTADWAHKSINPDIDNVLGMAHLFIHFELLGLAGEMFRDVVSLYRDSGLIVPVDKSSVSHPWSEDTMVQGKNMSPLARAFIGYGSCLAMSRNLEESLRAFNEMLGWQPDNIEGLMKAGEVLGAAGHYKIAHKTLQKVVNLGAETYAIRISMGSFLFKEKLFESALHEFMRARVLYVTSKASKNDGSSSSSTVSTVDDVEGMIVNRIGKCYKDMGESLLAVETFKQCLVVDPKSKEYLMDLASVLMERGEWRDALPVVEQSIQIDPNYQYAFGYRGLLKHTLGWPRLALDDLMAATNAQEKVDNVVAALAGVCHTCLGEYNKGIKFFNSILKDAIHHVWFRREMAYYYIYRENKSLKTYNYDDDLHIKLKYGMSQHDSFVIPNETEYTSYKKHAKEVESVERSRLGSIDKRSKEEIEEDRAEGYDVPSSTPLITEGEEYNKAKQLIEENEIAQNNRIEYLLKATGGIAKLIQLDHPGFLPNQRQHRQFGLAVLQLAQSLNEHISLRYDSGNKGGLPVPDAVTSRVNYAGWRTFPEEDDAHTGFHVFGWRDLFDTVVRWRQLSEPMDVVYWLDRMDLPDIESKRVGLNTYMLAGTKKITRYHTYNDWALNITRDNLQFHGYMNTKNEYRVLPPHLRAKIEGLHTHKELYEAVGGPYYQILPVGSIVFPGRTLNGTHLTLQKADPEGYDFSICSATTKARSLSYQVELNQAFLRVEDALMVLHTMRVEGKAGDVLKVQENVVTTHALELFYYWVNYAPITRGTSATGYGILLGIILAMNSEPADPVPYLTQYDWEAMFAPNPALFVTNAMRWIGNRRETSVPLGLTSPHTLTEEQRNKKEEMDKCINRNAMIKVRKEGRAGKKAVVVNDDGTTTVIADLDLDSTLEGAEGEEISCDLTDDVPMNKLRVVDVFDSIKSVVKAMNAFGERDPSDPL